MAYVERLVSLVGIMVSLAAVTVKELRLERKKYQCLRPRLCYAYRKHGHYACSCTLQVPEKENKNVNRKYEQKEKKIVNDTYLDCSVKNIRLMKFAKKEDKKKRVVSMETGENSLDGEANGLREDRRVQSVEVIVDDACKVIGSPSKNKEAVIIDDLERNLKFDENGIKLDDDSEGEVANGRVEIKSDSIVEDVDDDSETLGKDGHEFSVIKGRGNIGSCDVKAVMKDVERSKLMDQGNLRFRGKGGQIIVSVRACDIGKPRAYSRIDMRKIRAKARIDYQKSAETNNADEMSYDRGNSSTERNNPSNCYENGIGGEMAVGNDNVKGYSNNASICDHEFADDSKVDGMIDDERQNDEAMVLMEASLNVVMKMDMMMEGLVEMLRNWGKLNSANEFKINDEKG
ncbi:24982_t:CDS:2 [Gigaspora rosea]|nr:24982_t:CDS:2 [Gigaspora rosea]